MRKVLLILACMLLVFGLAASAAADSILQTMQEAEMAGWTAVWRRYAGVGYSGVDRRNSVKNHI